MTDNLEALSGLIKKELENYEDKIDVGQKLYIPKAV